MSEEKDVPDYMVNDDGIPVISAVDDGSMSDSIIDNAVPDFAVPIDPGSGLLSVGRECRRKK